MASSVARTLARALGLAAVVVPATAAAGEPSDRDRELARALDAEAEQAIREGHLEQALARYERSAELVDVPAHWLMIGRLRAQLGKPASALVALRRASTFPLRPGASPALRRAVEQAAAEVAKLEPRVPTIALKITGAAPTEVTLDDAPLDLSAIAAPHPVEPGTHRVVVRSSGQPAVEKEQTVALGEQATLDFRLASPEAPPAPAPEPARSGPSPTTIVGYTAIGVGVVGLAAGAITGLATLSRASQLANDCPRKTSCPAEDQSVIDEGRALGTASTVTFAVGGAALVTGVVLVVVGRRTAPPTRSGALTPLVGPNAVLLRGTF
jgi:hypothetical protein